MTPAASALDGQGEILALAEASEPLARMIGLVGDWLDTLGPGGFAGLPPWDRAAVVEALAASDPARDYPQDAPGWERLGFPAPPGSRGEVVWGDLGRLDPADAALASFDAAQPARPPGPVRLPSVAG